MPYSSIWDGILKILSLAATVAIILAGTAVFGVRERFYLVAGTEFWILFSVHFAGVVALLVAWGWVYYKVLSTVASYLHARITLWTGVTFADAKELRTLFQLDRTLTWCDMSEVRELPPSERREALLNALSEIGPMRSGRLL